MQSFGDTKVLQTPETPVETDLWEETTAWEPEQAHPTPRIADDVPEADLLDQQLEAGRIL